MTSNREAFARPVGGESSPGGYAIGVMALREMLERGDPAAVVDVRGTN